VSRQTWEETLTAAVADGTAIASTASETLIFPTITIPANYLADGRRLRIVASGKHSTTATPTLIFRLRLGASLTGTLVALSPTFTCGTVTTNMWYLEIYLQVRSNGSSGTVEAVGMAVVNGATVPVQALCVGGASAPAATTIDLTVDNAVSLTAQWSASSASNTLTGVDYSIEAMN
jgi:hypothetical protein